MKKFIALAMAIGIVAGGCSSSAPKDGEKYTTANLHTAKFAEVDINKDGKFTYEEFDEVTGNKGNPEGNVVYVQMDADGNGVVEEAEFGKAAAPAPMKAAPAEEKAAPAKEDKKAK